LFNCLTYSSPYFLKFGVRLTFLDLKFDYISQIRVKGKKEFGINKRVIKTMC
jgi:hypothetical protein